MQSLFIITLEINHSNLFDYSLVINTLQIYIIIQFVIYISNSLYLHNFTLVINWLTHTFSLINGVFNHTVNILILSHSHDLIILLLIDSTINDIIIYQSNIFNFIIKTIYISASILPNFQK